MLCDCYPLTRSGIRAAGERFADRLIAASQPQIGKGIAVRRRQGSAPPIPSPARILARIIHRFTAAAADLPQLGLAVAARSGGFDGSPHGFPGPRVAADRTATVGECGRNTGVRTDARTRAALFPRRVLGPARKDPRRDGRCRGRAPHRERPFEHGVAHRLRRLVVLRPPVRARSAFGGARLVRPRHGRAGGAAHRLARPRQRRRVLRRLRHDHRAASDGAPRVGNRGTRVRPDADRRGDGQLLLLRRRPRGAAALPAGRRVRRRHRSRQLAASGEVATRARVHAHRRPDRHPHARADRRDRRARAPQERHRGGDHPHRDRGAAGCGGRLSGHRASPAVRARCLGRPPHLV